MQVETQNKFQAPFDLSISDTIRARSNIFETCMQDISYEIKSSKKPYHNQT
jgi:hypothetical protein